MSFDSFKSDSCLTCNTSTYKELGECIDTIIDHRGKTPKKLGGDWINHGVMAVSAKNVKDGKLVRDESARYVSYEMYRKWMKEDVKKGDCFLVSEGATLGECMYWDFDFPIVLSQRIFCIRVNKDILYPKFFYAYMKTESFQSEIIGRSTGSSVSGLRQTELLKMKVLVPDMKYQRFIGDTLYELNKKIEINIQINKTLEAIAQALFKSWFVDFDPVHAKQQGIAPEGLDETTAALFPDGFEESELGLVPRGWKVMPVGDVVESVGGGTPDTKEPSYWESGIHCWTTPKDLSGIQAPVLLTTERKLTDKGLAKVSSGLLPTGTLLLSSRAPIGYLAIAQVPMAINQGYIAMLPNSQLPPLFMLLWLRQNMETIKGRANGSTFMEISKKAFRPIPILVPPAPVINSFVDIAASLFDRLVENEKQAQTLATLRDTLLPRLISGQLRLQNAESEMNDEVLG